MAAVARTFEKMAKRICADPNVKITMAKIQQSTQTAPKLAFWGAFAGLGAGWMVFPALGDEKRAMLGLGTSAPEIFPVIRYKKDSDSKQSPPTVVRC